MGLYDLGNQDGHAKLVAIRRELIVLKHEVKAAMKGGHKRVDIQWLNTRLQHIAKIPRPGLPKLRCNERCTCRAGVVSA